jgi:hypothetical protein
VDISREDKSANVRFNNTDSPRPDTPLDGAAIDKPALVARQSTQETAANRSPS